MSAMIAFREGAGVWGSNVRSRAVSRHTTSERATITEYETISARQNTNLDMKLSQPCNGDIPGDNKKMKTKKLQFIHRVNVDRSKTANIIKKVILPTITSPECQRDAE